MNLPAQFLYGQAGLDAQREQSQEMRDYYNRAADDPVVAMGAQELVYGFDPAHGEDQSALCIAAKQDDGTMKLIDVIAAAKDVVDDVTGVGQIHQDDWKLDYKAVDPRIIQAQMKKLADDIRDIVNPPLTRVMTALRPTPAVKPRTFHAHFEPREDRNCMVGWDGARE